MTGRTESPQPANYERRQLGGSAAARTHRMGEMVPIAEESA